MQVLLAVDLPDQAVPRRPLSCSFVIISDGGVCPQTPKTGFFGLFSEKSGNMGRRVNSDCRGNILDGQAISAAAAVACETQARSFSQFFCGHALPGMP